jgi:hypothetical protein
MTCEAYSNANGILAEVAGTAPTGLCFDGDWAPIFEAFKSSLAISLGGSFAGLTIGDAEPAAIDRDKIWLKVSSTCIPLGFFVYYGGSWKRAVPHHLPPGAIIDYYDATFTPSDHDENKVKVTYLDNYSETYSSGVAAAVPFWRICDGTNGTPDLRGRVRVGAGQGTLLANRLQGEQGGTESHTLTLTEIPTISMPISSASGIVSAFNAGSKTADIALNTGGGAHNNMQPFAVVYPIMRTSRII